MIVSICDKQTIQMRLTIFSVQVNVQVISCPFAAERDGIRIKVGIFWLHNIHGGNLRHIRLTPGPRAMLPTYGCPLQGGDYSLVTQYHFGGYAKYTPQLLQFIDDFEKQNNIPLEQVYTGKMMFGIYDLIKKNHFNKNSTVVVIHTGGLQGKLH